ncbi:MAG: putative lipid II flippase FtsW [Butyrivibrio sp.]|nr:putative lipid II flippase FtsW [Butyrivibrio sp.]
MVKNERKKETLTRRGMFFDYSMLIIVLFLVVFGLVMVYSTSSYSAMIKESDSAFYFKKQMQATALGLVVMLAVTLIDYHIWYKFKWLAYIGSLITVLLVLSPFGTELNGARRWIRIAGFSVQPAEIVKLAVIIMMASFISYSGSKMKNFRNNLVYCLMAGIAGGMIFIITENMSSAIIILGIAYVMLMIGNSKPKWLIAATIVGVLAVAAFLIFFFGKVSSAEHFRFKRLLAWRNPENYATDVGMQTLQALYALGSGGFFGKGLGQSIQKLGFLPEAQNDMVFSIICEELGLFGGICLILLFMLLIWRFMVIANNAPDLFGSMLVVGVMAHISIQVVLNVAVVTNLIPNTGVTLPFISYGGTSALFLLAEMGIVLNVSRQIRVPVTVSAKDGER